MAPAKKATAEKRSSNKSCLFLLIIAVLACVQQGGLILKAHNVTDEYMPTTQLAAKQRSIHRSTAKMPPAISSRNNSAIHVIEPFKASIDKVKGSPLPSKNNLTQAVVSPQSAVNSSTFHIDGPWQLAAPNIDATGPLFPWLETYIEFHSKSLQQAHAAKSAAEDKNKYLVFSCPKQCSGTGNRQRAIMATFMVAIATDRIFMIDIGDPVRLENILEPHKIQWSNFPAHFYDIKSNKLLKTRNKNPPMLDAPSKFQKFDGQQVLRIEANQPHNLDMQWKAKEIKAVIEKSGVKRSFVVPPVLYKQIFWMLYKPSKALISQSFDLREKLKLPEKYIAVHVRTGENKSWKDDDRFAKDNVKSLYSAAVRLRKGWLKKSEGEEIPIVVLADDHKAKTTMAEMGATEQPYVPIRYADTKIIHVDRSKKDVNDLQGSLAVWADILVLAQASCIVKGRGSFSMLGLWLSTKHRGFPCQELIMY